MLSVCKLEKYKELLSCKIEDFNTMSQRLCNLETSDLDDLSVLYQYSKDACFLFGVDETLKPNLIELKALFESSEFANYIDKFETEQKTLFLQLATIKLIIQSLLTEEETVFTSLRLLELGMNKLIEVTIKNKPPDNLFVPDNITAAFKEVNQIG